MQHSVESDLYVCHVIVTQFFTGFSCDENGPFFNSSILKSDGGSGALAGARWNRYLVLKWNRMSTVLIASQTLPENHLVLTKLIHNCMTTV